jgi:hypothetical protein
MAKGGVTTEFEACLDTMAQPDLTESNPPTKPTTESVRQNGVAKFLTHVGNIVQRALGDTSRVDQQ